MNGTSIPSLDNITLEISVQLLATLVGALVGFGLALKQDRKKKAEEKQETVNHLIESITEELSNIIRVTTEQDVKFDDIMKWDSEKHGFVGKRFLITTPAYDSAVNSGNFVLLPTDLQTRLSNIYNCIDGCKSIMEEIAKFYSTPVFTDKMADNVANNIRKNLLNSLQQLKLVYDDFQPYFASNKTKFLKS